MKKQFEFGISNLDCANCGNKIEVRLNKESYIERAELNFVLKKLTVETKEEMGEEELCKQLEEIADRIEKGVRFHSKLDKEVYRSEHTQACHCHDHVEDCCGHGHHHEEHTHEHSHGQENANNKYKSHLLIMGVLLYALGFVLNIDVLFMIAYVCVGYDVVWQAAKNLIRGSVLDENFLMTLATIAAFIIGEYPEAVAVMLFYKIGEYMQGRAVGYSRREIAKAMDIRPDFARVVTDNSEVIKKPAEVKVGDLLEVRVGEKLPLDGEIVEGTTLLDTSMLTGESIPVSCKAGDKVLSGSINKEGVIKVKVTTSFDNSTVSKILELIENATSKKSKSENFITKFARWYTPIVVGLAVFIAIIPSIITGNVYEWVYTSITFLVISCPCAVVVSVPLGFFAGLGAAAHKGVLVKGSNYLEALNHIDAIVLDKTGTITKGQFGITEIIEVKGNKDEVLKLAAAVEKGSNHPIAKSIVEAYKEMPLEVTDVKEISGEGIVAKLEESTISVGNDKLMGRYHIQVPEIEYLGSYVYVAKDNELLGCIVVADQIKEDSKPAIRGLKEVGIKKVVMLTGDKKEIAKQVGEEVGVDEVHAELLPQDKVKKLEDILKEHKAIFVGDGINDAPVLARADLGVAMGGIGSDAAIEAADIVLMTDELSSVVEVVKVAKRTRRIVTQNIVFALGTKLLVMILGIFGMANMWLAIFADVGVSLLAVMNSIRVLGGNLSYMKNIFKK